MRNDRNGAMSFDATACPTGPRPAPENEDEPPRERVPKAGSGHEKRAGIAADPLSPRPVESGRTPKSPPIRHRLGRRAMRPGRERPAPRPSVTGPDGDRPLGHSSSGRGGRLGLARSTPRVRLALRSMPCSATRRVTVRTIAPRMRERHLPTRSPRPARSRGPSSTFGASPWPHCRFRPFRPLLARPMLSRLPSRAKRNTPADLWITWIAWSVSAVPRVTRRDTQGEHHDDTQRIGHL